MTEPKLTLLDNDEGTEEVTPETRVIYEVKNYTDGEGRTIIGNCPFNYSLPTTYVGSFMVNTNMGPVRLNMDFPEGYSIAECFDAFDNLAQETVKKLQEEEMNKSRIVTPNQMRKQGSFHV